MRPTSFEIRDYKIRDSVMGQFKIDVFDHDVGDNECPECWDGFPRECQCGGLVHASFGDEDYEGDYWLYYKCDKCGDGFDMK